MLPYWACNPVNTILADESDENGGTNTYVVVCKHQAPVDTLDTAISLLEPPPVLLNHLAELRPWHATHQTACRGVHVLEILLVEPGDNLLATVDPLVPVPPDEWPAFTLGPQQLDALMELSHALGNLLRSLRNADVVESEGLRMEVLFEAAIVEGAEQAWSNAFAGQTTQDLQLSFSIDEVLDLGAVDTKKQLGRGILGGWDR